MQGSLIKIINGRAIIEVSDILDLAPSLQELNFVDGVTSAIQDQLNTQGGAITTHVADTGNPHGVTKTQVSLGNVTNDAQLKRAAGDIASFTEKTTPVAADIALLEDSADSNNKKRSTVGNIVSAILSALGVEFNTGYMKTSAYVSELGDTEIVFLSIDAGFTNSAPYAKIGQIVLSSEFKTSENALRVSYTASLIDAATCHTRIYVNGVAAGSEHVDAGTFSDDITDLTAGDTVEIWGYTDGSAAQIDEVSPRGILRPYTTPKTAPSWTAA